MAAALLGWVQRVYSEFKPPVATKNNGALRMGILGAANIAPMALITPAKSHPDVVVAAVAARDFKRATAFAKKHGIPVVHKTYDDLINDPAIDSIYNPLPNGLHYEWTLKALRAGKHVLLEKPSVSNAEEARSLFLHPILQGPNAPVLLEAFHYRFHPLWSTVLNLFAKEDVEEVTAISSLFAGMFPKDDIRFVYKLSGGTLMDFGTYDVSTLRSIFGEEPVSVKSVAYRPAPLDPQCDEAIVAEYEFSGGRAGKIDADLQAKGGYPLAALTKNLPSFRNMLPKVEIKLKPKVEKVDGGLEKTTRKEIIVWNFMAPHLYHRVDIITKTQLKNPQDGKVVKENKGVEYIKEYKWPEEQARKKGEEWWTTYRYMLEEFVNRVKNREGSGIWVEPEDSIRQMEMIDATYKKAGLPLRPTNHTLEVSK
ncbi:NAD(P)-binding protein [Periconia macrospinosa]|uniref:D-xylose 1-dehydrogenase (NADP(+), D-xylono-1,5-lactone-forming) n=1 Tax=Periconia macrospinosa TaxID=97972 RepID=A0A2V1EB90_9PLEO|nr:NAD(P)-binding protein [Periconia macrospinosa]